MNTTTSIPQISDEQISRYGEVIYRRTGVRVSPQKKMLLSNRIRRRLRETGIHCYDQYLKQLTKLKEDDPEWDAFLQEVTTHETYLFRDQTHWDWLRKEFIPGLQTAARNGSRRKSVRIWSAACSTGDEAYTIACCFAEKLLNYNEWKIEIVGTDIGVGALEEAREAAFSERAMKRVPEAVCRRFFTKDRDQEIWRPKPDLKNWTSFDQHNLLKPMKGRPFDLIVLKNVLIYFDGPSKQEVMTNVDRVLAPGGILLTGPAEGVSDQLSCYERMQSWLHHKPVA